MSNQEAAKIIESLNARAIKAYEKLPANLKYSRESYILGFTQAAFFNHLTESVKPVLS